MDEPVCHRLNTATGPRRLDPPGALKTPAGLLEEVLPCQCALVWSVLRCTTGDDGADWGTEPQWE